MGLARWAIGIAGGALAVIVVSYSIFGLTWAIAGEDAVSDNFVGYLAGFALVAGLLASLVAFVMALVAHVKQQRKALLWLPMVLLPTLIIGVTVVEVLWTE
jgi:hypothetical protein